MESCVTPSTVGKAIRKSYYYHSTKASGSGTVKVVNELEVEPNDDEAKEKNDEELGRLKQLLIEMHQEEVEKRDKEVVELTLKDLWSEWNVDRLMKKVIKNIEK